MTKQTNRDLLIAGLLACGWTEEIKTRTSKYRVFRREDSDLLLFVGKAGGLRRGKTVSNSVGLTGMKMHRAFIEVGKRAESWSSVDQARRAFNSVIAGKTLS